VKRRSLYFVNPDKVEIRNENLPPPGPGQVQLDTECSAISAGSEMLAYYGQLAEGMPIDDDLPALQKELAYPYKYGYSAVGRVKTLGDGVDPIWQDRMVFAFNPHESAFCASLPELHPLPDKLEPEDAVFLANLETALGLIMDGDPRLGERVVILGQGVVGLLTTALLARHPLDQLITLDHYPKRRDASRECGADHCLDPSRLDAVPRTKALLGSQGADLVFELSGQPEALNNALALVGDNGRVVVGSWYGQRRAAIHLDTHFHRGRIQVISSQVSHIQPGLRGRWDKTRRFQLAWDLLPALKPGRFISHRFSIQNAPEAYLLLRDQPDETLAVIFTY
jgi:2-desacetyl-2-hydroxyethyl bacteriochlorophyllide A dehydrogenase